MLPGPLTADEYDELTVPEVKDAYDGVDSRATLNGVLTYEKDNKARVTVTRWLSDRLADARAADDFGNTGETSDDGGPDAPQRGVVTPKGTRRGYIAGLWFDTATERRHTELDTRVEQAIDAGKLHRLNDDTQS